MDDSKLADLYEAIKNFCEQIYQVRVYDETNLRNLFNVFSEILKKAWFLPIVYMDREVKNTIDNLIDKLYSEMATDSPTYHLHHVFSGTGFNMDFDKLKNIDGIGNLVYGPYTAILDMYSGITSGMMLYEHGYTEYALLYWSQGFRYHWNWHTRDAIYNIHKMFQILSNREPQQN